MIVCHSQRGEEKYFFFQKGNTTAAVMRLLRKAKAELAKILPGTFMLVLDSALTLNLAGLWHGKQYLVET